MKSGFLLNMLAKASRIASRLRDDRRGAVTLTYAILVLTMLIALGTGMDASNALQVKYRLDLAADAGALACGESWQSTMEAGAGYPFNAVSALAITNGVAQGRIAFAAQAEALGAEVSSGYPQVSATPPSGQATSGGAQITCSVAYNAKNPDYLMQLAGFPFLQVNGGSSSVVKLPPYVAVYLVVDTSSSMMVGSTPETQNMVSNWASIQANYCMIWWDCPTNHPPTTPNVNSTPCGFACHDYEHDPAGTTTTKISQVLAQQELGEQVAAYEAYLGSKQIPPLTDIATRFDVMRAALVNDPNPPAGQTAFCTTPSGSAVASPTYALGQQWSALATPPPVPCSSTLGEGLLAYIRNNYQATDARVSLNTFTYSLYGFNCGINSKNECNVYNTTTPFTIDITDYSQYAVPTATNQSANPYGYSDISLVAAGVNKLMVGLNTHLNDNVMPQLQQHIVGTTNNSCSPAGACSENPLKFVILITDGFMSDRDLNWQQVASPPPTSAQITAYCALWNGSNIPDYPATTMPSWKGTQTTGSGKTATTASGECNNTGYEPGFMTTASAGIKFNGSYAVSTYAKPIDNAGLCQTLKANGGLPGNGTLPGVTIAVLETPYIPMTGQQPNTFPYEGNEQHVIYPGGPGSTSKLSTALQNCATGPEFYFQATADSSIANGFQQLFNNYVGQWVHLTH